MDSGPSTLARAARLLGLFAAGSAALAAAGCTTPRGAVDARAPRPAPALAAVPKVENPAPPALASPQPAPAAEPEGPADAPPRSLADLVDRALARDPATRAAWRDARAAAATTGSRRAAYLPTVDATGTLQTGAAQRAGAGGPSTTEQTTATAAASLTWLLLDLGGRSAAVDEADRLLAATSFGHLAAMQDLVLRVEEAYFAHLAALALVEAETASVRSAEASLAAAEDRRRAGLATIADVLQARTARSQALLRLQQAEGQALAVRGALATLAGLPPDADLSVGALPADVAAGARAPAIAALLEDAARRNPDLGRARAQAGAAEARARGASRAGLPTLSLQAGANRTWYVRPDQEPNEPGWNVGLVLRAPLFEGLRPAYDALAAREAADAARDRAQATGERVALDVWTQYQGVHTAGRRVETARDLVESARASAEVAAGRYKEGVGSILDLLAAQSALDAARAEDVRARSDYLLSLSRLARATGRVEASPAAAAPLTPAEPSR
jgi:outer membrane protein TolC